MTDGTPRALDIVCTAIAWFNQVGARAIPLTREGVAQHFHPESSIMIDTVMKGVGVEGFYQRFEEMLDKLNRWEVTQPFTLSLSEGDRAAAHYQYIYEDKQGEGGVIDIVSIWTVRDGKVFQTVENATYKGATLDLESYT